MPRTRAQLLSDPIRVMAVPLRCRRQPHALKAENRRQQIEVTILMEHPEPALGRGSGDQIIGRGQPAPGLERARSGQRGTAHGLGDRSLRENGEASLERVELLLIAGGRQDLEHSHRAGGKEIGLDRRGPTLRDFRFALPCPCGGVDDERNSRSGERQPSASRSACTAAALSGS